MYKENVESSISFFLNIAPGSTPILHVVGSYKTEPNFDFFKIRTHINGVSADLVALSGEGVISDDFALGNVSGVVEVELVFTSDPAVNVGRVEISSVEFRA